MMSVTQEYVKALFDYKEGVLYWKIRKSCKTHIGDSAGTIVICNKLPRIVIRIDGKTYLRSRLIFLLYNSYFPSMVDHKNHNTLDDRIENLRAASSSQNQRNRVSAQNKTSKYLGVFYNKKRDMWSASIVDHGIRVRQLFFQSEELAALKYNEWALEIHKEFANLNIIN